MSETTGTATARTSVEIGELAKALAAAQGEMEPARKDGMNPHFKSKYADLASVVDAIRGPLAKHGIAWSQLPYQRDGWIGVVTRLMHESGQWIECDFVLRPTKPDPQGCGSCLTYVRRYALMAVCGIAPDDDDGNAASAEMPRRPTQERPQRPPEKPAKTADPPELDAIKRFLWKECGCEKPTEANVAVYFVTRGTIDNLDSVIAGGPELLKEVLSKAQKKRGEYPSAEEFMTAANESSKI